VTKVVRIRDRGSVTQRYAADVLLESPGDCVLVNRGVLRSLVMACPDGCGDTLTINLDPRTDKAWRFYRKRNQVSVFPSIWRDTGCMSHFIIWNHIVVWCDSKCGDRDVVVEGEVQLRERVLPLCTQEWQHFTQLAERLDQVPWDVNRACCYLSHRLEVLIEGVETLSGYFKLSITMPKDDRLTIDGKPKSL
jgi:Family of unknown function (DUF6527)